MIDDGADDGNGPEEDVFDKSENFMLELMCKQLSCWDGGNTKFEMSWS